MKKTKIICTIGPASFSERIIKKMFKAGMNGIRINTAYGTPTQYEESIKTVREIADIPIIMDIKGPEIRLKASQQKVLHKGDIFEVGFKGEEFSFNHDFYDEINTEDIILIDNGKIETCVDKKSNWKLQLRVLSGGSVEDGKGVNVPNKHLSVPTLSDWDLEMVKLYSP